jgi:hypothetical protein
MRLVIPETQFVKDTADFFTRQLEEKNAEPREGLTAAAIQLNTALAYDGGNYHSYHLKLSYIL